MRTRGLHLACRSVPWQPTDVTTSPATTSSLPGATCESFREEVSRLVKKFESEHVAVTDPGYSEARVRQDYLDPFFRSLGWDLENRAGLVQQQREVEIESRTDVAGRAKRADYLFRLSGKDRFVCEAKKPREDLGAKYAFQAKRYAWNKTLPLALLTDFEELKIYVVSGKPQLDQPDAGLWKSWRFDEFPSAAQVIWQLLAKECVAAGSIEALLNTLPKRAAAGRGKARQLYLIKPDRSRALDSDFLNFLDESRRELASDLLRGNDRAELLEGGQLNEAVQSILDRLLFLRICEDRDIDTGMRLQTIVERWQRSWKDSAERVPLAAERESLWDAMLGNIRALDRRPPTHVPYFNGNLFKPHPSEQLSVSDDWLTDFTVDLSADESPYLFNVIPVEILGSVYERFLGKVVRPHGRGVVVEEKPEVRRAGGVYYTPRFITDYIVEQALGPRLDDIARVKTREAFEKATRALRVLDPACGSGSFLIRAFERICEHWQRWLALHPEEQRKSLCWKDPESGDLHLSIDLKRKIVRDNIYGVDIDPGAVEVTQLSLYLKMLEGETRITLDRQRELLSRDTPLLPSLEANIKCGNSLIAPDYADGLLPTDDLGEELKRANAFDWSDAFPDIFARGGFDAVVGNPPYIQIENIPQRHREYFIKTFGVEKRYDIYQIFTMRAARLLRDEGRLGYILPNTFLMGHSYGVLRKTLVSTGKVVELVDLPQGVFHGVAVDNVILVYERCASDNSRGRNNIAVLKLHPKSDKGRVAERTWDETFELAQDSISPADDWRINIHTNPAQAMLFKKLESSGVTLGDVTDSTQGIIIYETEADEEAGRYTGTTRKAGWKKLIRGKAIARYSEVMWSGEYISYGKWLCRRREERFFNQPKLLLHAMRNKALPRRLVATFDPDHYYNAHNLANIVAKAESGVDLRFVLGIFNSSLINYWYRAHFPNVNINPNDFRQIPMPKLLLSETRDRARHDGLVALVDKMLKLVPAARAESRPREKAVLERAVRSMDRRIDDLVCDLYGLSEEDRRLASSEQQGDEG